MIQNVNLLLDGADVVVLDLGFGLEIITFVVPDSSLLPLYPVVNDICIGFDSPDFLIAFDICSDIGGFHLFESRVAFPLAEPLLSVQLEESFGLDDLFLLDEVDGWTVLLFLCHTLPDSILDEGQVFDALFVGVDLLRLLVVGFLGDGF